MHICYTNLRASSSIEVGFFIMQLLETYTDILKGYLIHLQEHMVNVITTATSGARNIHVMIEFLLIILTDVPTNFIHDNKLFDLLARVGTLAREVSTLVRELEVKSTHGLSSNETNRANLDMLENIELLKGYLKDIYLKAPYSSQLCFPMSDGPLFMHLLFTNLNDLLNSNTYSVALIKKEIRLVKEDLEFIRFVFGFEEETNKIIRKLTRGQVELDVISITVWDELTRPFPKVEKGSRIILTSRDKKVALHAQCHSDSLDLRLLRPEENIGKESCPDELVDVGEEIVQNCKGLPSVVDLIAGVIARKEKKRSVWLEVLNNLHSFIFKKEVEAMKVIGLSYDHLPDHLKSCLLYFASYQKDIALNVLVMKSLWYTWRRTCGTDRDEEFGRSDGGDDRTCQINDLVHDFCLIKAREEKLFDLISSNARSSSSSSDLMPRQIIINYDMEHFGHINFILFDSKKKRHFAKHLYSLKITGHELEDSIMIYVT
ncbi:disease resistance RPP13-like protein 4 [Nicotiana tomentosiformis]|uniref:disease resistance RPP13-like protein 4 n=1 Tax=Nicotiana tomentosiformis TaxID=4098 RepID=UPI00388CBCA9